MHSYRNEKPRKQWKHKWSACFSFILTNRIVHLLQHLKSMTLQYIPMKKATTIACIVCLTLFAGVYFLPNRKWTFTENVKTIMLWTDYFDNPEWTTFFPNLPAVINVGEYQCVVVKPTMMSVKKADAVVMHAVDIRESDYRLVPLSRTPNQFWIYFVLESLLNMHAFDDLEYFDSKNDLGFNWTMSYSRKSDVWFPYGILGQIKEPHDEHKDNQMKNIDKFISNFESRTYDAVLVASNCRLVWFISLLISFFF